MSLTQLQSEILSRIQLHPIYLRKAEIDPWKDNPENLLEFIQEKSLLCDVYADNIVWNGERIMFARYRTAWSLHPVDLIVMNLDVEWNMKRDGEIFSIEDCGPDRGPVVRFDYDVITDEKAIFEEEMEGLLEAFVASILRVSIESLRKSGKQIEDSRKN